MNYCSDCVSETTEIAALKGENVTLYCRNPDNQYNGTQEMPQTVVWTGGDPENEVASFSFFPGMNRSGHIRDERVVMSSPNGNGIVIRDLNYDDEAKYMCKLTLHSGNTLWFETNLLVYGTYGLKYGFVFE